MATFRDGRGLGEQQKQRFLRQQQAIADSQRQAVHDTAQYAQTLLHGTPAPQTTGRRKQLYRRPRPFPIGYRTGNLARSMQVVYQQTGNGASGFLTFTDPAAPFVLSPEGTRNMSGTPFWNKVSEFYMQRSRQLAAEAHQRAGKTQ